MKFWFHEESLSDSETLQVRPEVIAGQLLHALEHRLGKSLKRLHGYEERVFRLRLGTNRAVFMILNTAEPVCAILRFSHRREVYRHALHQRAHNLLQTVKTSADLPDAYQAITVSPRRIDPAEVSEEPICDKTQATLVDSLLSASQHFEQVVSIGKGPPGSGKSVVAAEAAAASAREGTPVLILCPTYDLVRFYKDAIGPLGFAVPLVDDVLAISSTTGGGVGVFHYRTLFRSLTGSSPLTNERSVRFARWWNECLADPRLSQWRRKHHSLIDSRLTELVDSLFPDLSPTTRDKDALLQFDKTRLQALRELDDDHGHWLRDKARAGQVDSVGERALRACKCLDDHLPPNPVVIIDELQDLAPGERLALVKLVVDRRARGQERARLLALGDENQRLSPTVFNWTDFEAVIRREVERHSVARGKEVTRIAFEGSYRLPKKIADLAVSLLRRPLLDLQVRHVSVPNPESLPEGGAIHIHVCESAKDTLRNELENAPDDSHPVRILWDQTPEGYNQAGSRWMTVRQAKGLEFDSCILLNPLESAVDSQSLDFDTASRMYTAITRVRQRILIVLSAAEWSMLNRAEPWSRLQPASRMDRALLASLRETESLEEVMRLLVNRLEESRSADVPDAYVDSLATLAQRAISLGGAEQVARAAQEPLYANRPLRLQMYNRTQALFNEGLRETAAATLVLLGEAGAAHIIDSRLDVRVPRFHALSARLRSTEPEHKRYLSRSEELLLSRLASLIATTRTPPDTAALENVVGSLPERIYNEGLTKLERWLQNEVRGAARARVEDLNQRISRIETTLANKGFLHQDEARQ